ncbi:stAR-related lipid transfer protein 3-like isoform X1 [Argonauta hians]
MEISDSVVNEHGNEDKDAGSSIDKIVQTWSENISEWEIVAGENPIDGCVKRHRSDIYGAVTLLQARLNMRAATLFTDLAFNIDDQRKWNTLVSRFEVVEKISEEIDILYYVVPGAIPILINDRDFIIVRRCSRQRESYFQASCGTKHYSKPEQKKFIRGSNGPGGWILQPVPDSPNETDFLWFSSMKMEGNLPQKLIDQLCPRVMLSYLQPLRNHIHSLLQRDKK